MNLVFLLFITFKVILQCKFTFPNYTKSELNLLQVLNSYINKREVYLEKMTRYLNAIEESYDANTFSASDIIEDNLKTAWKQYKFLKRVTIDWNNFINTLINDDTYLSQEIIKSIAELKGHVYSHWILRGNDYKLIHIVRNLINVPQILSVNSREEKKTLEIELKQKIKLKLQKLKQSMKNFAPISRYKPYKEFSYWDDYAKLCRNEIFPNNTNLKCKYVHNNNPYLIIGPFKQEELHFDPQIYMYHDAISDKEIEKIQRRVNRGKMHISQNEETTYRVAKVTWLNSKKIKRRVELMTNLTMDTSAENLQIAVYGLAGHYEPHHDSGFNEDDPTHSRISTILFYMNTVTKGGNTVFPLLKLAVPPKKGAAVFWYNIRPNNDVDTRTLHAGCPTYSGLKWIMTSWVHHSEQVFTKPCRPEYKQSYVY